MQALAYLPERDVVEGLNYIKNTMNANFSPMITYLERNYIGNLKKGSKFMRDSQISNIDMEFI